MNYCIIENSFYLFFLNDKRKKLKLYKMEVNQIKYS